MLEELKTSDVKKIFRHLGVDVQVLEMFVGSVLCRDSAFMDKLTVIDAPVKINPVRLFAIVYVVPTLNHS